MNEKLRHLARMNREGTEKISMCGIPANAVEKAGESFVDWAGIHPESTNCGACVMANIDHINRLRERESR